MKNFSIMIGDNIMKTIQQGLNMLNINTITNKIDDLNTDVEDLLIASENMFKTHVISQAAVRVKQGYMLVTLFENGKVDIHINNIEEVDMDLLKLMVFETIDFSNFKIAKTDAKLIGLIKPINVKKVVGGGYVVVDNEHVYLINKNDQILKFKKNNIKTKGGVIYKHNRRGRKFDASVSLYKDDDNQIYLELYSKVQDIFNVLSELKSDVYCGLLAMNI